MSKRSVTKPAPGGRRNETEQLVMVDKRPTVTCANTWCGKRFDQPSTGRPKIVCSDACRQVLYRQRQKLQYERQQLAELQHHNYTNQTRHREQWISWLMRQEHLAPKLTQKNATRLYEAMLEAGRIEPALQRSIPHYLRKHLS